MYGVYVFKLNVGGKLIYILDSFALDFEVKIDTIASTFLRLTIFVFKFIINGCCEFVR